MKAQDLYLLMQRYNLAQRSGDADVMLRILDTDGSPIEAMATRLEVHFGTAKDDKPVLIIEGRGA